MESEYWTVFTDGKGYSQHVELTAEGTYDVWESNVVKRGLSRDEAMKLCGKLEEVWNGKKMD